METWTALFLAMMLDPVRILVVVIGAFLVSRWWHLLIVAFAAAFICETVLLNMQAGRESEAALFAFSIVVSLVMATTCYGLRLADKILMGK